MKQYVTQIKAIEPSTWEMKTWAGPNVPGISFADAETYCQNNGLGYCEVIGELVSEIPCKPGTYKPDWDKQVDYDNLN